MLAETFINPLNLPNLLTPFRYNLEIQYVVISILFISLLGYVFFTFVEDIGVIDKLFILLAVFAVLLFLYLVIKERNRIDDYTLQEETVGMERELAQIDKEIKEKEVLKDEASEGVIYENDQRIETGKADLARVNNYKNDINKLKTRKKELLDKRKNYDSTYLSEASDFVKKQTETEVARLKKENKLLDKEIRYTTGVSSEEIDEKLEKIKELEYKKSVAREKGDKKDTTDLDQEIAKTKNEIYNLEQDMELIDLSANDRVRLDRSKRKMEENMKELRKSVGLFGRDDNYILKKREMKLAEDELEEINNKYLNADEKEKKKIESKLVAARKKVIDLEKYDEFDIGNKGIKLADELINKYDNEVDSGSRSIRARQLAAFNKLEKLEGQAEDAARLAKSAANINESLESKNLDQQKEALARTAYDYLSSSSNLTYDDIKSKLKDKDLKEAAREAAFLVEEADKKGYNKTNLKTNIDNKIRGSDDNIMNQFLNITSGRGDQVTRVLESEKRSNRTPEEAAVETYNSIMKPENSEILRDLATTVKSEDGRYRIEFENAQRRLAEGLDENIKTYEKLKYSESLPGQRNWKNTTDKQEVKQLLDQIENQLESNIVGDLSEENILIKRDLKRYQNEYSA